MSTAGRLLVIEMRWKGVFTLLFVNVVMGENGSVDCNEIPFDVLSLPALSAHSLSFFLIVTARRFLMWMMLHSVHGSLSMNVDWKVKSTALSLVSLRLRPLQGFSALFNQGECF